MWYAVASSLLQNEQKHNSSQAAAADATLLRRAC
jgi:hypothetical protein